MNKLLLSVHVVAAIILIGPITVPASLFPRFALQALSDTDCGSGAIAALLHRITRVYVVLALVVPLLGVVLAVKMGVLANMWVLVSLLVTAIAAWLLVALVMPAQTRLVAEITISTTSATVRDRVGAVRTARRLSMSSGVFALMWLAVVVLMVVRPGSTTGI